VWGGGELHHAPLEYSQKHPIVLPNKHHFTKLIIRDVHYRNLHAGPQAVLATLRNDYWPIAGKGSVCQVLRNCIVCFRTKPVSVNQLMGSLPAVRTTQARPFLNTSIDYAGPFNIKISHSNKIGKAYLTIFICLATKVVHFELVTELSSIAFLNALKRFISRREKCATLYSDNSTTFTGANNRLIDLKKYLAKETTQQQIHEIYIRAVYRMEFHSPVFATRRRNMGSRGKVRENTYAKNYRRKLSFEELYTIMTQIEACLNSRPITPLSDDVTDLQALTLSHFIIGDAINAIPDSDMTNVPVNRLTRYQLLTQLSSISGIGG